MWIISYHTMSLLHIHPDDQSSWPSQSQYHDIRMLRYCHSVHDILACYVTSKLSPWWPEFMPNAIRFFLNNFYLSRNGYNVNDSLSYYQSMSLLHIHPDDQSSYPSQSKYDIRMPRYCHNISDILPCCVTSKLSPWWPEFTAFMVPSKLFNQFCPKHLKNDCIAQIRLSAGGYSIQRNTMQQDFFWNILFKLNILSWFKFDYMLLQGLQ